ncbi:manganese-dependent inorganic pyrophosphatase [Sediminitomix flava]|uniref:inorganic diphosphatase n=1 Tax=Sediminitomix flava TaxID=379075 RepID=A0A315ZV61_SEDFL|nr:manganese-dependent inorganic pyrophosphatase [Sediminitomix flava]PWJ40079.1 manganese-dependent inorganic pyrophosphatase [Sediminitomix flava]
MNHHVSIPKNTTFLGHTNPDTDAICSSIAAAYLWEGKVFRQGNLNPETIFVLNKFGVETPAFKDDFKGEDVVLVDHNQTTQSADSVKEANLLAIIDHHAVQDNFFFSKKPMTLDIRTVASCCTIIADYYKVFSKEIPTEMAGLMLAGILSDTLVLSVPHTTDIDRAWAEKLAKIAGIESVEDFGNAMLEAKSDLSVYSAEEILTLDFKNFVYGDVKIGFGVCESLKIADVLAKKSEIDTALAKKKEEGSYTHLFFAYVDLKATSSKLSGADATDIALLEKVFSVSAEGELVALEGKISRKNDFIPPISEQFGA